jgi:hypothetical protein
MDLKNKIKINSFEVTRMYLPDIPEVLKMAIEAQSSFGLNTIYSPTAFIQEVSKILQENTRFSFVFRSNNKIFGAFIIKAKTSKSADLLYAFSNSKVIQTPEMYDAFLNKLNQMPFDIIKASVLKKRKKFQAYIKLLNILGFKKIFNENDSYLTLSYEKSK